MRGWRNIHIMTSCNFVSTLPSSHVFQRWINIETRDVMSLSITTSLARLSITIVCWIKWGVYNVVEFALFTFSMLVCLSVTAVLSKCLVWAYLDARFSLRVSIKKELLLLCIYLISWLGTTANSLILSVICLDLYYIILSSDLLPSNQNDIHSDNFTGFHLSSSRYTQSMPVKHY